MSEIHQIKAEAAKLQQLRDRKAFSIPTTAWILGVSRSTVFGLIAAGELRRLKIGSRSLVTADEIDRFLRAKMEAA